MTTNKKKTRKKKSYFWNEPKWIRVTGAFILFLCTLLSFALVSYYFTWKVDQDQVLHFNFDLLFQNDIQVKNALGKLGALFSCLLTYWGFGIPSFFLIIIFARLGLKMIRLESWKKFLSYAKKLTFGMFFFSLVLATIFQGSAFPFGGAIGDGLFIWISSLIGIVGLIMLVLFIITATFLWYFDDEIKDKVLFKYSFAGIGLSKQSAPESETPISQGTETVIAESDEDIEEEEIQEAQQLEIDLDDERVVDSKLISKRKSKEDDQGNHSLEIKHNPEHDEDVDLFNSRGPVPINQTVEEVLDQENFDPKAELSTYEHPILELLHDYDDKKFHIDKKELQAKCDQIIATLLNYKIEIKKITATIGPTVTLYEVVPAPGVRISKIKNLEDDIALSLSALGIRIIAPIPGKGTVGIEVPNKKRQIVSAKEVLRSTKFREASMQLPIALGKTISNEVFIADLAKMPHLLVAGATGQGKSVGINTMLISLLFKLHPAEMKLVMIDPKMVELSLYSKLEKHFMAMLPDQEEAIITDTTKVIHTLNSLCIEMDERYEMLKNAGVRNLKEYNKKFAQRKLNPLKGHKYLPYLVLVIDEFADLIMTAGKEIELPIARLAQKARAVGIHLIIATQRPSVNIITGMIKANFPARLAFKVQQKVDSRTILDTGGADQLTGMGDMLLSAGGKIIRIQCAFVDTPEVEKVIEYISEQRGFGTPYILPEYTGEEKTSKAGSFGPEDLDKRFDEAAQLVINSQSGSTSNIQRKLQLGYNRAGRIMDQMEALGIVGEARGSKPREVLVTSMEEYDQILTSFRKA